MATASVSYTFVNGTTGDGTQVTQNFTDVVNFLNNSVVHKDGSTTMTGALTLPASDPVSANQAARKSYVDLAVPVGSVFPYIASTAPNSNWMVCDGAAISRTTYATLFALIGTAYGVGDGSTTFNLPDLRGRVPVGSGTGAGLTARSLGTKAGSENLEAHSHQTMGSNTPLLTSPSSTLVIVGKANAQAAGWSIQEVTFGATTTSTTGTGNAGNMQPFTVVNFLIKIV